MSTSSQYSGTAIKVKQPEAFTKVISTKSDGLSPMGRSAVAVFEEYVVKMAPDLPQVEAQAIRYQVGLYRAIVNTINKNNVDFNRTWGTLLEIFETNKKGAFNERALYRYMANITLSKDQCTAFRKLTVLMRHTAPLEGRGAVLKLIDLNRVLDKEITPEGRQRILNYYNQYTLS